MLAGGGGMFVLLSTFWPSIRILAQDGLKRLAPPPGFVFRTISLFKH
jgi:hypothetical protein